MGTDQLVPEVDEEVVPKEALGGLLQVRYKAADVAVGPPAFGGELLPKAVLSKGGTVGAPVSPWCNQQSPIWLRSFWTQRVLLTRGTKLNPKRPRM